MRAFILGLLVLVSVPSAWGSRLLLQNGSSAYVTVEGHGPSVFVLINGLEYDIRRWDNVAQGLVDSGATVIRYALPGQPEDLRLLKKGEEPAFFARGLQLSDLASQLEMILKAARVSGPVHLVGLSYGASVAATFARTFPSRVSETTFISPLVVPLDNYDVGGQELRAWLEGVRFWEQTPCELYGAFNPLLCVGQTYYYDQLYQAIYQSYLMDRVQGAPAGVDPVLFKKGVYHLVRAARDFDLKAEIGSLPRVAMLVGALEDADLAADQLRAWNLVPRTAQVERVVFVGAHHALPDEDPSRVVTELLRIAGAGSPGVTAATR